MDNAATGSALDLAGYHLLGATSRPSGRPDRVVLLTELRWRSVGGRSVTTGAPRRTRAVRLTVLEVLVSTLEQEPLRSGRPLCTCSEAPRSFSDSPSLIRLARPHLSCHFFALLIFIRLRPLSVIEMNGSAVCPRLLASSPAFPVSSSCQFLAACASCVLSISVCNRIARRGFASTSYFGAGSWLLEWCCAPNMSEISRYVYEFASFDDFGESHASRPNNESLYEVV